MRDLGKTLLNLSDKSNDTWTINDALKGTSIMGGTGSGKTSASGKAIAHKFLKEGWGGLVLCAKTDEAELWEKYCKETGRWDDLIVFSKGATFDAEEGEKPEEIVFNPIDYEMKREGDGAGETQNITNIFMNIYRMGNRIANEGDTKEERYWDTALKRCLNRVIELLKLAGEDLSYSNMVRILSTSKIVTSEKLTTLMHMDEEGKDIEGLEKSINYCLKCLFKALKYAEENEDNDEIVNSFNMVEEYFTSSLPSMGSRTKSVVMESFMGLAEPFLSGMLRRHFSGATNIYPEWTYQHQKIIVLDFPIKEYLDAGIMAQCVFKLMFQQAVERRNVEIYPTPVFLWCDEAQYFVNPYDQIFLTTARSSRTATVYLSQNISNYFAVMGSGSDAKARVDSLMGNLSTKVFHANTDAETNEYASRLIGNDLTSVSGEGQQYNSFSLTDNYSYSTGLQFLPQIFPKEYTTLKSGGESNDKTVQCIVVVSGRKWADGKNYLKTSFKQTY